ncbi:MAG: DUF86 domain-containing protein [Planctomycetota bacterium]
MSRDWRLHVQDSIACCEAIGGYTQGLDRAAFEADRRTYDAVLRNLEVLGEAVRNVLGTIRAANPQVPWAKIVGMRNILTHAYFAVDNDIVWDVVANGAGQLLTELRRISARAADGGNAGGGT